MPHFSATYRHSLREAAVILTMWFACLIYTCTYCYLFGYLHHEPNPGATGTSLEAWAGPLVAFDRDPNSLTLPLGWGMPDWIFYGIFVPWALCIVATFWFCLCFFADDDLGQASADDSPVGETQR